MTGPLTDKVRLLHIIDAMQEIENYLNGVSKEQFLNNSEKRFATIKQIEIIGEACDRINEPIKLTTRNTLSINKRISKYFNP